MKKLLILLLVLSGLTSQAQSALQLQLNTLKTTKLNISTFTSYTAGVATTLSGLPTLSQVATAPKAYSTLTGTPTIPTVPAVLSAFTNDAGYQTSSQVSSAISAGGFLTTSAYSNNTPGYQTAAQVSSAISAGGFATTTFASNAANQTTGILPGARMPAITGDVTSTTGSTSLTLNSIITAGSVGSATNIPILTYDAKGRITGASSTTFSAGAGFTEAQVRTTPLTGFLTTTTRPVVATDNVVTGLGLLQAQLNQAAVSIDPTFAPLTFGSTTNYPYTVTRPNASLTVTGNTSINLTGTANGDAGFLRITKTAGSEVVTFPGLAPAPLKTTAGAINYVSWINNAGQIEWILEGSAPDLSGYLTTSTYTTNRTTDQATAANSTNQTSGTLPVARLPALTGGDVTSTAGGGVLSLSTVITAGTVGSGSLIPIITYDAKGRIISVSTAAASGGGGSAYTPFVTSQRNLGAAIKYESDLGPLPTMRDAYTIGAGRTQLVAFTVTQSDVLTGVGVYITNPGSYTGNNSDAVAIYSAGAAGSTVLTKVASSAFSSTMWTASAGHLKINFSSTYTAAPGEYYIAISHDRSAVATPPEMLGISEQREFATGLPGAKLWTAFVYGNSLPATINVTDMNLNRTPVYSYTY